MRYLSGVEQKMLGKESSLMTKSKEWLKTITFYEILIGMKATLKHLLHYRPITLQYPHEKRAESPGLQIA